MAGFNVRGIWSRNRKRTKEVAKRFNVPRVFDSLEELISSEEIDIVDIALPPRFESKIGGDGSQGKKTHPCPETHGFKLQRCSKDSRDCKEI